MLSRLSHNPGEAQTVVVDADWGQEQYLPLTFRHHLKGRYQLYHPALHETDTQTLASSEPRSHPLSRATIELSQVFRTSMRYSLRKSWLSASLFFLVIGIFLLSELTRLSDFGGYRGSMVQRAEQWLILVHALFVAAEVLYWELYRRKVRFSIQGGRFHVRRGLVRRLETSAPLAGATEFFISQSACDAVLGIYSLLVLTPLSPANAPPRFTRIDGLSRKSAEGLMEWLVRYVREQEG